MDYAFVGAAGPMVVSVLFARFYLSIFFVAYNFFLALLQVFAAASIEKTFFSFEYNEIAQNINAINGGIFSQNITFLAVVAVGLITLAWVIESNLREATLQERSNNLLGRYFSPEVRDEIEKILFSYAVNENDLWAVSLAAGRFSAMNLEKIEGEEKALKFFENCINTQKMNLKS